MAADMAQRALRHDAFISYSRRNADFARRLQKALEDYTPPADLPVPQRPPRVFRDESDFTGSEYFQAVAVHLADSAKLILLCSPAARASSYVDDEIRRFVAVHGAQHIIPVLVAGVPNNEAQPGQEGEMAFPAALCEVLAMPLAADYRGIDLRKDRPDRDAFEGPWYTLLANLYGLSRSQVEQRDKLRLRRRRRILATLIGAVMLALTTLAGVALWQKHVAQWQQKRAMARQLAAQAQLLMHDELASPRLPALLALQSLQFDATPEALDVIDTALARLPPDRLHTFHDRADPGTQYEPTTQLVWAPSGRYLAAINRVGEVKIWDLQGAADAPPRRFQARHWAPALLFSPASTHLAVRAGDARGATFVDIARLGDGAIVASASSDHGPLDIAAWHRGAFLVGGMQRGGQAVLRDLLTQRVLPMPRGLGTVGAVAWAQDAGRLLVAAGRTLTFWDPDSASVQRRLPLDGEVDQLVVSSRADMLALRLRDQRLYVGNGHSLRPLQQTAADGAFTPRWFTPGGRYLVAAEPDGRAFLRDVAGRKLFPLRTEGADYGRTAVANLSDREAVMAFDLSRHDAVLADARRDGTVSVWQPGLSLLPGTWGVLPGMNRIGLVRHGLDLIGVRIAPDARHVLTLGSGPWMRDDGVMQPGRAKVRIWEGEREVARLSSAAPITALSLSPDGMKFAVASATGDLSVYCVCSNVAPLAVWRLPAEAAAARQAGAFAAGSGLVAAIDASRGLMLWHAADDRAGQIVDADVPHSGPGEPSLRFSSDGRMLAWWSAAELRVYDTQSRRRVALLKFPGQRIDHVALAAAAGRAAVSLRQDAPGSQDATVRILGLAEGRAVETLAIAASARVLTISPDGSQVLVYQPLRERFGVAGNLELWHLHGTPERHKFPGDDHGPAAAAFSPDGKRLLLLESSFEPELLKVAPVVRGQALELWDLRAMHRIARQELKAATRTNVAVDAGFGATGEHAHVVYRRLPQTPDDEPFSLQVFDWDDQTRAARLLQRLPPGERQLTAQEWQQYLPDLAR